MLCLHRNLLLMVRPLPCHPSPHTVGTSVCEVSRYCRYCWYINERKEVKKRGYCLMNGWMNGRFSSPVSAVILTNTQQKDYARLRLNVICRFIGWNCAHCVDQAQSTLDTNRSLLWPDMKLNLYQTFRIYFLLDSDNFSRMSLCIFVHPREWELLHVGGRTKSCWDKRICDMCFWHMRRRETVNKSIKKAF